MTNTTHTEIAAALNAIIATVPTNVESPVTSQPRLRATAYAVWGSAGYEKVRVRIDHTRFDKPAETEMFAYKKALCQAFRAAGYSIWKVKGGDLRLVYCSSIGHPKDGLRWDLEVRVAADKVA